MCLSVTGNRARYGSIQCRSIQFYAETDPLARNTRPALKLCAENQMLEYIALGMLLPSLTALFYILIFIHDIPYMIAKRRNHPQQEAIHYACWLSLFTLHAMWPIVFLWAVSNRGPIEVAPRGTAGTPGAPASSGDTAELRRTIESLQARLAALENAGSTAKGARS